MWQISHISTLLVKRGDHNQSNSIDQYMMILLIAYHLSTISYNYPGNPVSMKEINKKLYWDKFPFVIAHFDFNSLPQFFASFFLKFRYLWLPVLLMCLLIAVNRILGKQFLPLWKFARSQYYTSYGTLTRPRRALCGCVLDAICFQIH